MRRIRPVHLIAMIIGLLGIAYSVYGYLKGRAFEDYFPTFIICLALFGVAYLNSRKAKG